MPTDDAESPTTAPADRTPRWGLLAAVAGGAVVLALVVLLIVRVVITNAGPPLGVTAVTDLQPGSCLAEKAANAAEYTVVSCSTPHPQQVIAEVDLALGRDVYTSYDAVPLLAQKVCERYLEYDLYVEQETGDDRLSIVAMGVPSEAEFDDGRTTGYCAVVATDGTDLTTDDYRPIR